MHFLNFFIANLPKIINVVAMKKFMSYTITLTVTLVLAALLIACNGISGGNGSSGRLSNGLSDVTAPTTPTDLTATVISSSQINLTWTASVDNTAVMGYNIYRDGPLVGVSTSNSYSSTGLSAEKAYSYTVQAYDGAGNMSGLSESVSGVTNSSQAEVLFEDDFSGSGFDQAKYDYIRPAWQYLFSGGYEDNAGAARVYGGEPLEIPIPDGYLELYVRFYVKVTESSAGNEWLKIFGERNGTTYANTTFGRIYLTGYAQEVSYGGPGCSACDTQATTKYPSGSWFPSEEWTYYEAHIKFAQGPEWGNGIIEVWYGNEQKLSVTGIDNRNTNHEGLDIGVVSISDDSSSAPSAVGYMWIDNLVISTERIGP